MGQPGYSTHNKIFSINKRRSLLHCPDQGHRIRLRRCRLKRHAKPLFGDCGSITSLPKCHFLTAGGKPVKQLREIRLAANHPVETW
jgi:hypothetical protein